MKIGETSLLIALGHLLMMYPVLAKVRYDEIGLITADRRMIAASLLMNWIVGPLGMFTLAWLLLADQPAYRTGVILVGLARCIAMVLLWDDLACGDREMAAVLVALNALFHVVAYAALGCFYLAVLSGWLGLEQSPLDVSMLGIAKIVAIFLGIPLVAGYLIRTLGERAKGREWFETTLLPTFPDDASSSVQRRSEGAQLPPQVPCGRYGGSGLFRHSEPRGRTTGGSACGTGFRAS